MDLGILQVLAAVGFTPTAKCYFVRHQDKRYPVEDVGPRLWLEHYQEYQSRDRFHKAEQLVSFYGLSGTRAGFFGIYTVRGHRPASEGRVVPECPWSTEWREPARVFYDLERDKRFDDLRDRIIIDWGTAYRTWVQKASNKPVLEIQEPGRRLPPFDDYLGMRAWRKVVPGPMKRAPPSRRGPVASQSLESRPLAASNPQTR